MSEAGNLPVYQALFGELRQHYSGEGRTAHYAELASEVARQQPDVIFTITVRMVQYFKAATAMHLDDQPRCIGLLARAPLIERSKSREAGIGHLP
jgi:hypothetical protein